MCALSVCVKLPLSCIIHHREFIAKITDSPNMVCMINHAMRDLLHRILDFSRYYSLHCHVKMERVRERGKIQVMEETVITKQKVRNRRAAILVGMCSGHCQH